MDSTKTRFNSIDEYIATFPEHIRKLLQEMRAVIKAAAPEAQEKISYQMPTFFLQGNLVHFAAFKNHIGFYPAPSGIEAFARDLSQYKSSKGAVQFPIDKPIPYELVERIVRYRVDENNKKARMISSAKKRPSTTRE
jgi:uncharacterized protein YdhG (YjbR/CyaY superfamily)